ncbi:MAG: serine acetyltransferase [Hyphomicrobiales bacterium]
MTDAPLRTEVPPMPRGVENCNPAGLGFWQLVAEDYRTHDRDPFAQGLWALFVHRFGNWRMGIENRWLRLPLSLLYKILYKLSQFVCGIDLPYTTRVGRRVKLEHFGGMILVARSIGDDVVIRQNTTFGVRNTRELEAKPMIGDRVDIGAGAVLLGHIRIGDDSVIGANAVVLDDVPAGALAVGVPARIIDRGAR